MGSAVSLAVIDQINLFIAGGVCRFVAAEINRPCPVTFSSTILSGRLCEDAASSQENGRAERSG
jgi:hypothetical protein